MSDAGKSLERGARSPYDAPDAWWEGGSIPPDAADWAHRAARGVLADLCDRKGIKNELDRIDEKARAEIVSAIAEIVRLADREK